MVWSTLWFTLQQVQGDTEPIVFRCWVNGNHNNINSVYSLLMSLNAACLYTAWEPLSGLDASSNSINCEMTSWHNAGSRNKVQKCYTGMEVNQGTNPLMHHQRPNVKVTKNSNSNMYTHRSLCPLYLLFPLFVFTVTLKIFKGALCNIFTGCKTKKTEFLM